jgi:hypothetical protein
LFRSPAAAVAGRSTRCARIGQPVLHGLALGDIPKESGASTVETEPAGGGLLIAVLEFDLANPGGG